MRIFLAISGFLITRILVLGESGDLLADLKRFYIRRTLRIFPLYYAVIAWLWTLGVLQVGVWWYLTYTYNIRVWLAHDWGGPLGHLWTLSVEEQFYLIYPPAFLWTPSRFRPALIGALLVASKAFQGYADARMAIPWAGFLLPYCGEFLLWGCLAGVVETRTTPGRWEGPLAMLGGLALILWCRASPGWMATRPGIPAVLGSLSGFGAGSALVVFGLWRADNPWIVGPFCWRPIAYLGRISYGLYVYHYLVIGREWLALLPESYLFRHREPYGEFGPDGGDFGGVLAVSRAADQSVEGSLDVARGAGWGEPRSVAGPGGMTYFAARMTT